MPGPDDGDGLAGSVGSGSQLADSIGGADLCGFVGQNTGRRAEGDTVGRAAEVAGAEDLHAADGLKLADDKGAAEHGGAGHVEQGGWGVDGAFILLGEGARDGDGQGAESGLEQQDTSVRAGGWCREIDGPGGVDRDSTEGSAGGGIGGIGDVQHDTDAGDGGGVGDRDSAAGDHINTRVHGQAGGAAELDLAVDARVDGHGSGRQGDGRGRAGHLWYRQARERVADSLGGAPERGRADGGRGGFGHGTDDLNRVCQEL